MSDKQENGYKEQRNERYNKYVEAVSPKTGAKISLWNAFWIGGLTCSIAQGIYYILIYFLPNMDKSEVANITSLVVIAIAILLTGLGFFDVIARKGGAGSFLPITGFANAMVSAAMEYKTEGLILGTSTKLFTVVGPVIVNGLFWSTIAGIIRWLLSLGGF